MTDTRGSGPSETSKAAQKSSPNGSAEPRNKGECSDSMNSMESTNATGSESNRTRESCRLTVNGGPMELPVGSTIRDLLDCLEIRHPAVAVELNEEIQPREQHDSVRLKDGDRLEIVSLVGGG